MRVVEFCNELLYDTVGGFLIYKLGYIPEENTKLSIADNDVVFTIEEIKDKKIEKVRIEILKQMENNTSETK